MKAHVGPGRIIWLLRSRDPGTEEHVRAGPYKKKLESGNKIIGKLQPRDTFRGQFGCTFGVTLGF